LVLVDALGNLVRFSLWPGQRHDSVGAPDLIDGLTFEALLGDKAFDNNGIRENLERRGAEAVIPSKADRKVVIPHDQAKYQWRHLIENYFSKACPREGGDQRFSIRQHTIRQNRHQLQSNDQSRCHHNCTQMIVHRL
jgi:hypothetical protein